MKQKKVVFTVLLVAAGYFGAAIFYWRWWPAHSLLFGALSQFSCPVCPHVDGTGTNWEKFFSRAASFGLFNAVLVVAVGWAVVGLVRLIRARVSP
jgi:hypothetical protein